MNKFIGYNYFDTQHESFVDMLPWMTKMIKAGARVFTPVDECGDTYIVATTCKVTQQQADKYVSESNKQRVEGI